MILSVAILAWLFMGLSTITVKNDHCQEVLASSWHLVAMIEMLCKMVTTVLATGMYWELTLYQNSIKNILKYSSPIQWSKQPVRTKPNRTTQHFCVKRIFKDLSLTVEMFARLLQLIMSSVGWQPGSPIESLFLKFIFSTLLGQRQASQLETMVNTGLSRLHQKLFFSR